MSTGTKRTLADAQIDAVAFIGLFHGCYEKWSIAGSVRRGKPECGDVEHVACPRIGEFNTDDSGSSLFATVGTGNMLWHRLDQLVATGTVAKHLYTSHHADGTESVAPRWGDRYRGVDFRGFNHEIFLAEPDTWGSVLVIRTGSADFSKLCVTNLLRSGRRNKDGAVWACEPCRECSAARGKCRVCDGTKLVPVEKLPCPTEHEFFGLAGMAYVDPEDR